MIKKCFSGLLFIYVFSAAYQWNIAFSTPIGFVAYYDIINLILIGLYFLYLVKNNFKLFFTSNQKNIIYFLLFVILLMCLTSFLSINSALTFGAFIRFILLSITLLIIIDYSNIDKQIVFYILYGLVLAGITHTIYLLSTINIVEFLLQIKNPDVGFSKAREYGTDVSLFDNINRLGEHILVSIGALISLFLYKKINRVFFIGILLVLIIGVLFTMSRQALLTLVMMLFVFSFYMKFTKKSLIQISFVGIPLIFSIMVYYIEDLMFFYEVLVVENFSSIDASDTSISNRLERQIAGIKVIIENPLGLGYGTIKQYVINNGLGDTHHFFLNVTLQLGVIGGFAFLLLWGFNSIMYFRNKNILFLWIPIFIIGLMNLLHLGSMILWLIIIFPFLFKGKTV